MGIEDQLKKARAVIRMLMSASSVFNKTAEDIRDMTDDEITDYAAETLIRADAKNKKFLEDTSD